MKYSRACTVNFENIPEIPWQKLLIETTINTQAWRNWSRSGFCYVSNASEYHESIAASPALPCKIPMSTILSQKTPCKMICCRKYLSPVDTNLLWQSRTCFSTLCLSTRHLTKSPKRLLKSQLTSCLSTLTYQRYSSGIKTQRLQLIKKKEESDVLGITQKHANTKHAQTLGILERSHASIEQGLWRLKQLSGDHFGKNMSGLRSLITTHLTTQLLAVKRAEDFMDASLLFS